MSCLKLHWPQTLSLYPPSVADWSNEPAEEGAPVILSFPGRNRLAGNRQIDLLNRARLIFANRHCPECSRAAVVPIDSEAALMSRNRMPIPGTGRLIGFECDCCGHSWSAE